MQKDDTPAPDDTEFSDEHPLASPGELAGTADQAIARELEALGPVDESLADASDAGEEQEEAERNGRMPSSSS